MYIHLFKWSYIYFYVSIFFLIWFINEIFLLLTPYFSVFHKIVNTHNHTEYLACCDRQPDVVYSKQIRQYHNALILAIVSSSVANIFKKSIYDITSSILCCINCLWKSTNLSMPLFLTLFNKQKIPSAKSFYPIIICKYVIRIFIFFPCIQPVLFNFSIKDWWHHKHLPPLIFQSPYNSHSITLLVAYCANTLSFVLQINNPIVALSSSPRKIPSVAAIYVHNCPISPGSNALVLISITT